MLVIASESIFIFLSLALFSCFVFLILRILPLPSPSRLFPPLQLSLELLVLPRAALGGGSFSPPIGVTGRGTRCCISWYPKALPALLRFGDEETQAGNGIGVSAERCLSQASFYFFILTPLYLTARSLEIQPVLPPHAVPTRCALSVSTS